MDDSQVTNNGSAVPDFNVSDLMSVRTIIDVAARRGAFGAAEMSSVGAVYTKLDNFLNVVAPPQTPASDTASTQG
jgi:fructose/tagatose bisphosphate aldolase